MTAPRQNSSTEPQVPATAQQAPLVPSGLFKGIAVVIDDAVNHKEGVQADGINEILKAIRISGGHAVVLDALPTDDDELDGFSNAAFFIMDWNLKSTEIQSLLKDAPGVDLGGLREAYEQENIAFLTKLRRKRHAPVFIMTNESVDHVINYLRENHVMCEDGGDHIMVKHKSEVGADLYTVLEKWLQDTPSALLLKHWEQNQTQAMNELFNEFYDRNKYWPIIFWNAYKEDGVAPHAQLGELINRLVDARMKTLTLDLGFYAAEADRHFGTNAEGYKQSLHKVLQSERLLPNDILNSDEFAPGDLFNDPDNGRVLLNVRPICDCVQRPGIKDDKMYLLRGLEIPEEDLVELADHTNGNFREKDNETIVFALRDGKTYSFSYRTIYSNTFSKLKAQRLGRILPPFLTKITQRYAAYSHRPGLPRVPSALMPQKPAPVVDPIAPIGSGVVPAANSCEI